MRYPSFLLLLSFFSLTVPACAQKATLQKSGTKANARHLPKTPTKQPAPTAAGPILTFERTPCFGTCASYTMQVYADGRVAYEGRRFVPAIGKKDLKLPAPAVADLLRQAQESHFDQFQARYSSGISDVPSTIIGIRQPNGELKTVTVESGAPDNVRELFAYFGQQLDTVAQLNSAEH